MPSRKVARISEHYNISDAIGKMASKVKEHVGNMICDSAKSSSKLSLLTEAEVTHGGIVNANLGFYRPEKLRDSVKTWLIPYPKPVMTDHATTSDNIIGRVKGSIWKSFPPTVIPKIKNSIYQTDFSYRGLGCIQNLLDITDPDAATKVLDGRYLTMSVHGDNDAMICSICNQEWVNDGKCYHRFGETYENDQTGEDELCYWTAGNFLWDEQSFVKEPADPFAQIIVREVNSDASDQVLQTYQYRDVTKNDTPVCDSCNRLLKFYAINDSKGAVVELGENTDLKKLYQIYDLRLTSVGIDLTPKGKEPTTVADQTKTETPATVAAPAAPAVTDTQVADTKPEATVTATIADAPKATETPVKPAETPASMPSAATASEAAASPKIEDSVLQEKIKTAVEDAKKPLETQLADKDKALKTLEDEKKTLSDSTISLQADIRNLKIDQILDFKETLKLDTYPTEKERQAAKDSLASRPIESLNDTIKDLRDALKKQSQPKPAMVTVGDSAKPAPSAEDTVMQQLSKLSPEQIVAYKLSGRINFPTSK